MKYNINKSTKINLIPKAKTGTNLWDINKFHSIPHAETTAYHIYRDYDKIDKNGHHKTYNIPKSTLRNNYIETIQAAYNNNIDPYLNLSISKMETENGATGNPLPDGTTALFHLNPNIYGISAARAEIGTKAVVDRLAEGRSWQKRGIVPNNEAALYQAIQGYHLPQNTRELQGKNRGVPIPKGGLDLKKNPLYGKEVLKIMNMFRNNPDVHHLVDSLKLETLKPQTFNTNLIR